LIDYADDNSPRFSAGTKREVLSASPGRDERTGSFRTERSVVLDGTQVLAVPNSSAKALGYFRTMSRLGSPVRSLRSRNLPHELGNAFRDDRCRRRWRHSFADLSGCSDREQNKERRRAGINILTAQWSGPGGKRGRKPPLCRDVPPRHGSPSTTLMQQTSSVSAASSPDLPRTLRECSFTI